MLVLAAGLGQTDCGEQKLNHKTKALLNTSGLHLSENVPLRVNTSLGCGPLKLTGAALARRTLANKFPLPYAPWIMQPFKCRKQRFPNKTLHFILGKAPFSRPASI